MQNVLQSGLGTIQHADPAVLDLLATDPYRLDFLALQPGVKKRQLEAGLEDAQVVHKPALLPFGYRFSSRSGEPEWWATW